MFEILKHYNKLTLRIHIRTHSVEANSSVEKAGILGSMRMRLLPSDENGALREETVRRAMEDDCDAGLIPCYVRLC